jgi:hypothetical protein
MQSSFENPYNEDLNYSAVAIIGDDVTNKKNLSSAGTKHPTTLNILS